MNRAWVAKAADAPEIEIERVDEEKKSPVK